jgi:hypothetical protein
LGSRDKPKVPAVEVPRARGPLRIGAPVLGIENHAALRASSALILQDPAPGGALAALSPLVAAMLAPPYAGSIDRALREAEAILGPFPPATEAPVPPEVAPFMTGMVATPRRLATVALGPLITLGSHFLELLVVVQDWSFTTLWLLEAIRRAISTPSLSVGEVVLVEQSRPELIWPVDIILGMGGNAVLSRHWRAFSLGHHLHVDDRLVFYFRLGALEASMRVIDVNDVRRTYPLPR